VRACPLRRISLDQGAEAARLLLSLRPERVLWLCRAGTSATVEAAESELAGRSFEVLTYDSVPPSPAH